MLYIFDVARSGLTGYWSMLLQRPRGPMDKASAYGAGDCRFESCQGHIVHLERYAKKKNKILCSASFTEF